MMRLKWFFSFLLLAVLGVGSWALFPRQLGGPPESEEVLHAPVPEVVKEFRQAPPVERVQELYAQESKRIGEIDPDPELTQQRLELLAGELSAEEISWLKGEAGQGSTADGRFFATYLLALSSTEAAVDALGELAVSPVPKSKNKSLFELERQIRAQATEGLGRACAKQVSARDALLDVVEKQADEFLRERAHRALYQCRSGKPVEAQDREALEKVIYGR